MSSRHPPSWLCFVAEDCMFFSVLLMAKCIDAPSWQSSRALRSTCAVDDWLEPVFELLCNGSVTKVVVASYYGCAWNSEVAMQGPSMRLLS